MEFTEQEVEQICGGFYGKQKKTVFQKVKELAKQYIDENSKGFIWHDLGDYKYLDKAGLKEYCTVYVKKNLDTKSLGIPYIILWWILPYIIDYIIDRLIGELNVE